MWVRVSTYRRIRFGRIEVVRAHWRKWPRLRLPARVPFTHHPAA